MTTRIEVAPARYDDSGLGLAVIVPDDVPVFDGCCASAQKHGRRSRQEEPS
jgi:hypothetical protein